MASWSRDTRCLACHNSISKLRSIFQLETETVGLPNAASFQFYMNSLSKAVVVHHFLAIHAYPQTWLYP
ncbi:hypothetical protein HanIR_Chr16g0819001 [Helianthus annuus]|nr:hypothetical protein HanIR_Chr16g0819001 [Helianthus annuus]